MYFEAVSNRRINYLLGSENMYKSNGPGGLLVEHPGEQRYLNRRGSCVYGILITVESEPELLFLYFLFFFIFSQKFSPSFRYARGRKHKSHGIVRHWFRVIIYCQCYITIVPTRCLNLKMAWLC